mgnify:CR=1 FL=1
MARLTKNQKESRAKVEANKVYSLEEASSLVKEITNVKFDASARKVKNKGTKYSRSKPMLNLQKYH